MSTTEVLDQCRRAGVRLTPALDFAKAMEGKETSSPRVPSPEQRGTRAAHQAAQSRAATGGQEGTIVPRGDEKGRGIPACPLGTSADEFEKYARQDSNL
jgi:hypothetical protein